MKTTRSQIRTVLTLAAVAMAIVGSTVSSANATLVPVLSYTGSNNKNNYGGNMSDLFSGEEITKTDPNDPSTWTASGGNYTSEWQAGALLSGATNSKIAWTAFDFGSSTAGLENMYLWNIRQATGQNARTITYNVYHAVSPTMPLPPAPTSSSVVDYDFASGGWTLLNAAGVLTMPQRGAEPDPADQVLALGGISARYLAVEILTNGGSTSRAGLSEVAVTAVPPEGFLHIFKFVDADGNGIYEQGEELLPPGSFMFDIPGVGLVPNCEEITLEPGLYTASEILHGDWYATTPNPFQFEIVGGQLTEVYFGNKVPEPASALALLLGLGALGRYRRRRSLGA